jgi:hypothetical protein
VREGLLLYARALNEAGADAALYAVG